MGSVLNVPSGLRTIRIYLYKDTQNTEFTNNKNSTNYSCLGESINTFSRHRAAVTYSFSVNAQLYSSIAVENCKKKYSF